MAIPNELNDPFRRKLITEAAQAASEAGTYQDIRVPELFETPEALAQVRGEIGGAVEARYSAALQDLQNRAISQGRLESGLASTQELEAARRSSLEYGAVMGEFEYGSRQAAAERIGARIQERMKGETALGVAGIGAEASKYGARLGLRGVEVQAGASRYGAELGLQGTQAQVGAARYGAELGLRGTQAQAEAARYGAEQQLLGTQATAGATEYSADQQLEAATRAANTTEAVAGVRASADKYIAEQNLLGTEYSANRRLEADEYVADAQGDTARAVTNLETASREAISEGDWELARDLQASAEILRREEITAESGRALGVAGIQAQAARDVAATSAAAAEAIASTQAGTSRYAADQAAEASNYAAEQRLAESEEAASASRYASDQQLAAAMQASTTAIAVANVRAAADEHVAAQNLLGTQYSVNRGLEASKYVADAQGNVAKAVADIEAKSREAIGTGDWELARDLAASANQLRREELTGEILGAYTYDDVLAWVKEVGREEAARITGMNTSWAVFYGDAAVATSINEMPDRDKIGEMIGAISSSIALKELELEDRRVAVTEGDLVLQDYIGKKRIALTEKDQAFKERVTEAELTGIWEAYGTEEADAFSAAYQKRFGDPEYRSRYDFDGDGFIDFADFIAFSTYAGMGGIPTLDAQKFTERQKEFDLTLDRDIQQFKQELAANVVRWGLDREQAGELFMLQLDANLSIQAANIDLGQMRVYADILSDPSEELFNDNQLLLMRSFIVTGQTVDEIATQLDVPSELVRNIRSNNQTLMITGRLAGVEATDFWDAYEQVISTFRNQSPDVQGQWLQVFDVTGPDGNPDGEIDEQDMMYAIAMLD